MHESNKTVLLWKIVTLERVMKLAFLGRQLPQMKSSELAVCQHGF